jgi:Fibronectin type III domain
VEYDDVVPWPTTPDGTGPSLTRLDTQTVYGHDPTNWTGAAATPGSLPLPAPATDLTASATAVNRVHLAWLDPATNETGFKIERSTDGANFTVVATLSANTTAYDDVNLQSSVGYFYRVRSFNDAGNAAASNTAQATTPQLVTINGSAGHDTYHVRRVGTQIHVFENTPPLGAPTYSSELAALGASLTINTLDGDDTLTVATNGQPALGVSQLVFNSGSGANALQLTEGAALIDSTVDAGSALATTVSTGAQLTTARLNQTGLTLSGAGTKVTIQPDGGLANVLESLTLDATSTLDLTNNDLVLRATAANKDAIHADAQTKILSAQNGVDLNFVTNWNGPGITSTSARTSNVASGFDLVALGLIRNSDLDIATGLPGSAYTSFGGVPVTADDVLLKYTYTGDGNLDGAVTFDDYAAMDAAFFGLVPSLGWATGDINFDNLINFDDYSVVDQAFFLQGAPLATLRRLSIPWFD